MLIFVGVSAFLPAKATVDLHLQTCSDLAQGRAIGLRAYLYDDLLNPSGARPIASEVAVRLRAHPEGTVLAETRLEPSAVFGMEGNLSVPSDLGQVAGLFLEATAARPDGPVHVRAPMHVDSQQSCLSRRGRAAHPLQTLLLGGVMRTEDVKRCAHAAELYLAVEGGACVPGHRCTVWAWSAAAEPEASLKVSSVRGVEAIELRAIEPPTAGAIEDGASGRLFTFTAGVRTPEAAVLLSLERPCGTESRELQLPVALGAVPVSLDDERVQVAAGEAVALDLFAVLPRADALVWSGSLPASEGERSFSWPRVTMPAGAVAQRLSVRPDALGVESELALHRPVASPTDPGAIRPWLSHLSASPALKDAPEVFVFAVADSDVIPRAGTYSSAQQGETGDDDSALWATKFGQILLFLLGLLTSLRVYRGGARALRQVQALGREMEDEVARSEARDVATADEDRLAAAHLGLDEVGITRSRAQLLGLSVAVFLAFIAVAVILGVQMGRPG